MLSDSPFRVARQRMLIHLVQAALFAAATITAFLLRFELTIPATEVQHLRMAIAICVVVKTIVFTIMTLDRDWWRYVSVPDLSRLAAGNLLASVIVFAIVYPLSSSFPRSIYILDLLLCILFTASARVMVRVVADSLASTQRGKTMKRCLIYGAGEAGLALLREVRQNPALGYTVCGFIDDNRNKIGMKLQGTPVVGDGNDMVEVVRKRNVETVLIAIPSASGVQMTKILERCSAAGTAYKTIPGLADALQGNGLLQQIRDVAVEDLLGRSPVRLEQDHISSKLQNRTVIITGAAGSIGSELCRQIARFSPSAIVAYEAAETPLFHLQREMDTKFPGVTFHPVIGSIQNPQRLMEAFKRYNPSVVYHAAAYKHVPLMEIHPFEAIENNVFGTFNVAQTAARCNVEEFVMISSDKAVHPTSVMGATKRLAELVIRSLQNGGVKFVSVRFGNVLGSNGSVVPIFKEQIARGGPVTVTHPDMRRYFMTIPEACQLVLQASTMAQGGEIFVLDMGEPVRIVDLARNLILLSGLRPHEDIKIQFSGLRPGEKLYEELNLYEENTLATHHEKIKTFNGTTVPWREMEEYLGRIRCLCNGREIHELVLTMKEIIPDYNPSSDLLRTVLRRPMVAASDPAGEPSSTGQRVWA